MQLQPLVDALREIVLGQQVINADETPVQMLMPGTKKTHRSYVRHVVFQALGKERALGSMLSLDKTLH